MIAKYQLNAISLNCINTCSFRYQTGGLFHPEDDKQEVAFRYAVERVNADRTVLPRAKLLAQVETISPQDSFHASKRGMLVLSGNIDRRVLCIGMVCFCARFSTKSMQSYELRVETILTIFTYFEALWLCMVWWYSINHCNNVSWLLVDA